LTPKEVELLIDVAKERVRWYGLRDTMMIRIRTRQ
jgi:hypothetical protein